MVVLTCSRRMIPSRCLLFGWIEAMEIFRFRRPMQQVLTRSRLRLLTSTAITLIDVVVSNHDDSTVRFYRNIGGGIMSPLPVISSTGANTQPQKIVAADVNDDGLLDYITANYGGGGISVILSESSFTYISIQGINTQSFNPNSLVVARFNNDPHVDLGVANHGGGGATGFVSMAGFGKGYFAAPIFYNTSGRRSGIAAGVLDSDGNIDVALVHDGQNSLAILFGNSLGILSGLVLYPSLSMPQNLVACNANRDGFLDLHVTMRGDGTLTLTLYFYLILPTRTILSNIFQAVATVFLM